MSTPGDRSKEIQALLRLEQVETLRTVLQKIANVYRRSINHLKAELTQKTEHMTQALEISRLSPDELLRAVNQRRTVLKLPEIETLTATTSVKDGLAGITKDAKLLHVPKKQASVDLKKINATIRTITSFETSATCIRLADEVSDLSSDPIANQDVTRENFLKTALQFLEGQACPVCDTPWDIGQLRSLIEEKLKRFDAISRRRSEIERKIKPFVVLLESLQESISIVRRYRILPADSPEITILDEFGLRCEVNSRALRAFLPIKESIQTLQDLHSVSDNIQSAINKFATAVDAIPEPTDQDAARDFLVMCQERLETYRSVKARLKRAEDESEIAKKVSEIYDRVSTDVLNGIYEKVQNEFSEYYRAINPDDESGFTARLLPSAGKLGFDVDFYGRGFFPPGAYHSEGHQDGMGLCLYLALMNHLQGTAFNLAVLDDVLMSVDSDHRREACALLKRKFPDTQFILTTHDKIWLKHMESEGLIAQGSAIHFRTWDVNSGPREWHQLNVWQEIEDYLRNDDVRAAAGLLRHYLEYVSGDICHRLRAPVEYRGDARFQLGELLPSAVSTFSKLLQNAKTAEESWGHMDKAKKLAEQKEAFSEALKKRIMNNGKLMLQFILIAGIIFLGRISSLLLRLFENF